MYNCKRNCRRGNKRFDVHLWRIRTVHFLSKDEKGASYEGTDGWNSCLFPARVGTPTFDAIPFDSAFPYLYLDLACKQLCFPPGKGINRRNKNTSSELFGELLENCLQNSLRTIENSSITFRAIQGNISHNLWRAFQNLFETCENCIKPT